MSKRQIGGIDNLQTNKLEDIANRLIDCLPGTNTYTTIVGIASNGEEIARLVSCDGEYGTFFPEQFYFRGKLEENYCLVFREVKSVKVVARALQFFRRPPTEIFCVENLTGYKRLFGAKITVI